MSYLIPHDYNTQIQDVSLQQIISGNAYMVATRELSAQTEITSYLVQKYDVKKEFTDTGKYNPAATYKAHDRVYLDATAYLTTSAYGLNDLTIYNGNVYINISAISAPAGNFNDVLWSLLGAQYDMFYGTYPYPLFDAVNGKYNTGDFVFWNDKTYKALQNTLAVSHYLALQYGTTYSIPLTNIFPDDPVNGSSFWGDATAYAIPPGQLLNTVYFTKGDNRNQQMVMFMIDTAVYHLYSRIAPKSIPELRENRYYAVIDWLVKASKGTITADLPLIQPATQHQGGRIRGGCNVKQQNSY